MSKNVAEIAPACEETPEPGHRILTGQSLGFGTHLVRWNNLKPVTAQQDLHRSRSCARDIIAFQRMWS